jgi:hypothetical protein
MQNPPKAAPAQLPAAAAALAAAVRLQRLRGPASAGADASSSTATARPFSSLWRENSPRGTARRGVRACVRAVYSPLLPAVLSLPEYRARFIYSASAAERSHVAGCALVGVRFCFVGSCLIVLFACFLARSVAARESTEVIVSFVESQRRRFHAGTTRSRIRFSVFRREFDNFGRLLPVEVGAPRSLTERRLRVYTRLLD